MTALGLNMITLLIDSYGVSAVREHLCASVSDVAQAIFLGQYDEGESKFYWNLSLDRYLGLLQRGDHVIVTNRDFPPAVTERESLEAILQKARNFVFNEECGFWQETRNFLP